MPPRCDDCSNKRCSCRLINGDNTVVLGTGSPDDPYRVNATGGDGASLWEAGDIKPTARGVASAGWLICDGAAVSRITYADLFTAIGTTYGAGDGTNTFNLPDLAGRFPFGYDGSHSRGSTAGQEQITLAVDNLPAHQHSIAHVHDMTHTHVMSHVHSMNHGHGDTTQDGNHRHIVKSASASNTTVTGGGNRVTNVGGGDDENQTSNDGAHRHSIPGFVGNTGGDSRGGVTAGSSRTNTGNPLTPDSGPTGSGLAHTNMPPYTAICYVIKT